MTSKQLTVLCGTILTAAFITVAGNFGVLFYFRQPPPAADRASTEFGNGIPQDQLVGVSDGPPFGWLPPDEAGVARGTRGADSNGKPAPPEPPSSVPQELSPLPQASPIDSAPPLAKETVERIIAEELPQASAEVREIWFGQLQEMQAGQIRDILRMWRRFGTTSPGARRESETPSLPDPADEQASESENEG